MKALPIVVVAGRKYFVDERLGELRAVDNPLDTESIELAYGGNMKDALKIGRMTVVNIETTEVPWVGCFQVRENQRTGRSVVFAEIFYRLDDRKNALRAEANARLIAATPDLLAALEAMLGAADKMRYDHESFPTFSKTLLGRTLESARAAIAKAQESR